VHLLWLDCASEACPARVTNVSAAPRRLAAALAAAAPAEDILASLPVEIHGRGAAVSNAEIM